SGAALGQTGSFDITVGAESPVSINIEATDSLDAIVAKVNASGAKVNASVFYDGTNYYMQVAGQDTGLVNAVSFAETGTSLGLTTPANTKQAAGDAVLTIDGFTVTRSNNQISGAIQGLTLNLTETTASPVTVRVASDPDGLQTKLQSVVTAYNAVVDKIQSSAGYGSIKATNPVLAGDSMLRGLGNRLSAALSTAVTAGGNYQTLGSIGLNSDKSGKLSLDSAKLSTALQAAPDSVKNLLAGVSGDDGAMDIFRNAVSVFTDTGTGLLDLRKETLGDRAETLDERVAAEELRLERYAELLRKQFASMDGRVAASNAQMETLVRLYSGG
ncbi:MAG TPA: flagellar filament capping protein FliD, partial [Polyangiaceae bacterium]|nr:flagellar filament capping protein FliD [Polyangiaceae bacterium]